MTAATTGRAEEGEGKLDMKPLQMEIIYSVYDEKGADIIDKIEFGTYNGIIVKMYEKWLKKGVYRGFFSLEDVKTICKKLKLDCKYNSASKKMTIGKVTKDVKFDVVKYKGGSWGGRNYIAAVEYEGKVYFGLSGITYAIENIGLTSSQGPARYHITGQALK